MKKTLLSFMLMAGMAATTASAVTIDWSVDQILMPTASINSNVSTGTKVDYKFVLKNNGSDAAAIGDTVLYQLAILNGTSAEVVAPSSGFYFKLLTKAMAVGDTMHVSGSFTVGVYPPSSINRNFAVLSHLVNRSRGLGFETTTIANNQKTAAIVWYNPQAWPVSVANLNSGKLSIYPNVAKDNFTVVLPIVAIGKTTTVKVYSVLGTLITEKTFAADETNLTISTANIPNGTYLVSVETDGRVSTSKVIVQK
jgi:Secretion system C-terminal sorting domain